MMVAMPRVSPEHRVARREQILDAARRCFAANGFHSTSIQDILAASGLSAGALYGYFPGKNDIIVAIAEEAMATVHDALVNGPDLETSPLALLRAVLEALDEEAERNDVGRVALQAWAEAARSPALAARIADNMHAARRALVDRLADGPLTRRQARETAAVIVTLLPAYIHARVLVGDLTPAAYCRGLAGVATLIAAEAPAR
jgi:AcrR family transcriptional regulator